VEKWTNGNPDIVLIPHFKPADDCKPEKSYKSFFYFFGKISLALGIWTLSALSW
jgi:hypothetical protein